MSAPQLLAVQVIAGQAATRDRATQADLVLAVAVADAAKLIRQGKPGQAEFRLARAELSARRILGEAVPS